MSCEGCKASFKIFTLNRGFRLAGVASSRLSSRRPGQSFFTIRLWDSGDLLAAILKNNEKFPDDLQAELPLKRVWALVFED